MTPRLTIWRIALAAMLVAGCTFRPIWSPGDPNDGGAQYSDSARMQFPDASPASDAAGYSDAPAPFSDAAADSSNPGFCDETGDASVGPDGAIIRADGGRPRVDGGCSETPDASPDGDASGSDTGDDGTDTDASPGDAAGSTEGGG